MKLEADEAKRKCEHLNKRRFILGGILILLSGTLVAAPFLGPSRSKVLKMLASTKTEQEISLGQGEPQAVIEVKNGRWTLSPLERRTSAQQATPDGKGNFLPEMTWSELAPGKPIIEETSKVRFLKKLREIEWKYGGID